MYIERRIKRSILMTVVGVVAFFAVAYNSVDSLIFPGKTQATYSVDESNKEVGQVLTIKVRELFPLADFGSAYSIVADKMPSTENYAVWAVKDGVRIPIKTTQWLILDACEVRLSDESEYRSGKVTIMVRTLSN